MALELGTGHSVDTVVQISVERLLRVRNGVCVVNPNRQMGFAYPIVKTGEQRENLARSAQPRATLYLGSIDLRQGTLPVGQPSVGRAFAN